MKWYIVLVAAASAMSVSGLATPDTGIPAQVDTDNDSEPLDALVLAVHLTSPEVIDGCLNEIKNSKYDFVWMSIKAKEARDPINVTITLKASLIEKGKEAASGREATLVVGRDIKKLREGRLFFDCKISYETPSIRTR